jgi:SAM-dependent methyltransferase
MLGANSNETVLFDYIHARLVYTCFDSHLKVLKNIYKNLKPGGWVEYQDATPQAASPDGTHAGSATALMLDLIVAGGRALGRDFLVARRYKDLMKEAGFVDVHETRHYIPVGGWPADPTQKRIGEYLRADLIMSLASLYKVFRASLSQAQVKQLQKLAEDELLYLHRHIHTTVEGYVVLLVRLASH